MLARVSRVMEGFGFLCFDLPAKTRRIAEDASGIVMAVGTAKRRCTKLDRYQDRFIMTKKLTNQE